MKNCSMIILNLGILNKLLALNIEHLMNTFWFIVAVFI